ncbi:MAG TPA: ParB N-terminal domain-containing protein [Pirellulales bacterium]|nr:ParB N-terminal domain-containing protein [Pirellulales bacterium]
MSGEEQLVSLEVAKIRTDGGTQVREQIDGLLVEEYAERMHSEDVFPPIVVFFDGQDYWLADGFHRFQAHSQLRHPTVECRLLQGTRRDAVLFALKANNAHGLRRTSADKRHAVKLVLADEEWSKRSDRWIADVCGVGRDLVGEIRRELSDSDSSPKEGDLRVGQDGKLRQAGRTAREADPPTGDRVEVALRAAERFDRCLVALKKLAMSVEQLALVPGGHYLLTLRLDDFRTNLRLSANYLTAMRPSRRCDLCGGDGCQFCSQLGWVCTGVEKCG